MKSLKYLSSLKQINNGVRSSRAARGERMFSSLYPYRGSGYGWWGQNMGEQVQHFKNWTYVAVNIICSKIASMSPNMAYVSDQPIHGRTTKACMRGLANIAGRGFAYHGEKQMAGEMEFSSLAKVYPNVNFGDSGSTWLTVGEYRSKALSVIRPHEELEPLEMYHPLRRLFDNPNSQDTFFDLMYESQMFQELCGVSYIWVVPNSMGQPCELWVIPSHWVFPKTGGGKLENPVYDPNDGDDSNYLHPIRGSERLISHFEVRPWGGMGPAGALYIPAEQIIMERWKNPMDKINGYSTLTAIAQWVDLEESISKSRWAQMMNQARPEFWVEMGEGFSDVDNDQIARLESRIAEKLQGEYNYGKPFITPQGTKVSVLSFSPTEMAYQSSESDVRDMILSAKGIPKTAAGITESMTFGSILATAATLCHDEETECLTSNGWIRHYDITEDTLIACYNDKTEKMEYHRPTRIIQKEYKGPMHQWMGERIDALMTPGHRVHVQRFPSSQRKHLKYPWETISIDKLTAKTTYKIKRAAQISGVIAPSFVEVPQYGFRQIVRLKDKTIHTHKWLRFLGHWLSEGHTQTRNESARTWQVGITQSKNSVHLKSIQECLDDIDYTWKKYETGNENNCFQWTRTDKGLHQYLERHGGKGAFNKRIPAYVKAWPAEQLVILLDALIEGDGKDPWVDETTEVWNSTYFTSSKQLADDVMEIAIKCGIAASIGSAPDHRWPEKTRYHVNLSSRTELTVSPGNRKIVDYDGFIWCVTVPTGLFVVRRNGKAHITGNCENCINPRLSMRGSTMSKHLASKWDEKKPAWSSRQHGSSEIIRRVRMWWDNTVPADPAQVNADIQCDAASYAITPSEIRALRGRRPYGIGGDNPIVQGPGGPMPLPINVEEGMEDLGELIGQFNQAANAENMGKGDQSVRNELTEGQSPMNEENAEGDSGEVELPGQTDLSPVIEEPNGPPTKSWKSYQSYIDFQMQKAGFTGKRRDKNGRQLCYQSGKRVPCKSDNDADKKKPAAKVKPDVKEKADKIKEILADGGGAKEIAAEIGKMKVTELKELQTALGVSVKGNPVKAKRITDIAKQAMKGKTTAEKPTKPKITKPENKLPPKEDPKEEVKDTTPKLSDFGTDKQSTTDLKKKFPDLSNEDFLSGLKNLKDDGKLTSWGTLRPDKPTDVKLKDGTTQEDLDLAFQTGTYRIVTTKGVSKETTEAVNKAMSAIPNNVHKFAKSKGVKVVVTGKVTDYLPKLKGVAPRGWPQGATWDNADGLYNTETKEAIVTESTSKGKSSRTPGVVKHEYGHAIDAALGDYSNSPDFIKSYNEDLKSIPESSKKTLGYFLQSGDAGRSEAFAECFSQVYGEKGADLFNDLKKSFPKVCSLIKTKLDELE